MKTPTCGLRVASVLFGLMALAHLMRILVSANLVIGSCYIRRSWSAVAVVVLGALAIWMCKLACTVAKANTETPPTKPAA